MSSKNEFVVNEVVAAELDLPVGTRIRLAGKQASETEPKCEPGCFYHGTRVDCARCNPEAFEQPHIRVNHQGVAVDYSYPWLPMSSCPINADVWLLGANGIGVPGRWNGKDQWYRRWAPKPKLVDGPL